MATFADLNTCGRSAYSEILINQGGQPRPYNLAPFPPVHREELDCGDIFTFHPNADGTSKIRKVWFVSLIIRRN